MRTSREFQRIRMIRRLRPELSLGLCLLSLSACFPQAVPPMPSPSPEPSASAIPGAMPTPVASRPPEETPSAAPGSASPLPSGSPGGLPANLAGLRFETINRFLNAAGETTQFAVYLIDRSGNRILQTVPLEWSSSRPQDFSIDASGKIKALVAEGYSEIVVRIPGSSFEARTVINVSSRGSGGGGGGGGETTPAAPVNSPPTIDALTSSRTSVLGGNAIVKLTSSATDAETPLTESAYTWSCTPQPNCGTFSPGSGSTVYWLSPNTGGTYQITLSVSDGTQTANRSLDLNVQTGTGGLSINPP